MTVIRMARHGHWLEGKIKADDQSSKLPGELPCSDTSRNIIKCPIEKQMYASKVAIKLGHSDRPGDAPPQKA